MRFPIATLPLAALTLLPVTGAMAQTTSIEGRVGRLEQEMGAVQRKVFPDGAGKYLQPQVTAPDTPVTTTGTPASSQVTDLTARVSAVEAQLRTLTGQVEQNGYKVHQLEQAFEQFKAQGTTSAAPAALPALPDNQPAPTAAKPAKPAASAPSTGATDARKSAVAAIERPSSGNDAQDAYDYGFRLWSAKFYPEAQVQLKSTVDKYGDSGVASRAANLLGRAYLDDGKYALASVALYDNYQKRPKGDRASDSLTYLGEALIALKKLPEACKVYQELNDVFGATLRTDLKAMADKGKVRAKCGA
jgi:TolA-binding protein